MNLPNLSPPIDRANRRSKQVGGMTPSALLPGPGCDVACSLLPAPFSAICKIICGNVNI
jgi:hypothetical protein